MDDRNSNNSYRYKNYRNRNRRQSDHGPPFRNENRHRSSYRNDGHQGGPPPPPPPPFGNDGQQGFPYMMDGQQGPPPFNDPSSFGQGMQPNFPHYGNMGPPMFQQHQQQGFPMENFPHGPGFLMPQNQMGQPGFLGPGPPQGFHGHHQPPFVQNAQNYQNEQQYNIPPRNEKPPGDIEKPQECNDAVKLLSKLGRFLNYSEFKDEAENKNKENENEDEIKKGESNSIDGAKSENVEENLVTTENVSKPFNPVEHMPPLPPLPPPFQQLNSPSSGRAAPPTSYYTPEIENIPTPSLPYPTPRSTSMPSSTSSYSPNIIHPPSLDISTHPTQPDLNEPPPILSSSPLKQVHDVKPPISSPLKLNLETPSSDINDKDKSLDEMKINPQDKSNEGNEDKCCDDKSENMKIEDTLNDTNSSVENDKSDASPDKLTMAIQKQQLDVVTSAEATEAPTKTVFIPKEKVNTPSKKLNFPMLGKEAAKKILKSFSTNKALMREKPKIVETDEKPKVVTVEVEEEKNSGGILRRKKKNEKMSVIEQIKEEETRIKEVLSHTSNMFSSYGIGLGMPEINNFFDNPEALRKFQARGKHFVEKIEKGELVSPIVSSSSSKDKDRRSSSSHYKESSRDKNKESSLKKSKEDEGRRRSLKGQEVETPSKHKPREVPTSWREMRRRNMKMIDLWRIIDNARRKSRSASPNKDRKSDMNRIPPFPEFLKRFQHFKATVAVEHDANHGVKQYPGNLVQYTTTKPTLPYCVNSKTHKAHYWTRKELKMRNKNYPGIMKTIEQFWKAETSLKEKVPPSQRNWWTDNYLIEKMGEETDEEEEEQLEDYEKGDKERTESALDYLSSSYKSSDMMDKEEDEKDCYPKDQKTSSPIVKEEEDEGEIKLSKSEHQTTPLETKKHENWADIKLSTQELNEEYEEFINTLECKFDESCSTTGLSEDTLDFNSSLLSSDDIKDKAKIKVNIKEAKVKKKSSLSFQPKSVKEIKKILLEGKVNKRQRKELKRLKKTLKNEKQERKRLKKELKKQKRVEKKLKKKQKIKKEKVEHISVVSTRNIPENIEADVNYNEETYVLDEWNEEFDTDSNMNTTSPERVKDEFEKEDFSNTSGFHEQSQSSRSPLDSSSVSNLSCFKNLEEDSSNADIIVEETQDRYSPSNMSVCSPESPNETPSPDLCLSYDKTVSSTYPPSPYSPSSPQSSISDSADHEPVKSATSLDAIPLPSMQLSFSSASPKSNFKAVESNSGETSSVHRLSSDKYSLSQDSELDATQDTSFKKTAQPVVFKLGSKKQSGGIKLLQKAPLPGFAEIEDEEDRKSPLFDLHEGILSKDKLKSPLVDKSFPTKLSTSDNKAKPSDEEKRDSKVDSSSLKDSLNDSGKEGENSGKRSYSSSKDDEPSTGVKEKLKSSDSGKSSKRSESKKERDYKSGSNEKHRDRRSPSPKRRKERRRENSPENRRKRRSKSPESSRRSHKGDNEVSSYESKSRSPQSRSERSSGSTSEKYYSPDRFGDKDRESHRDSRSQSPSPKWKRIKSPPPKRYKESGEWRDERRRYYKDGERGSRSSYSPRSRSRSSSRLDSPENRSRTRSPEFKHSSEDKYSRYSPRPINSISTRFSSSETPEEHWDWASGSKPFYSDNEQLISPEHKEGSPSPSRSPKRLSLDERLKQEHGVEVNENQVQVQQEVYQNQEDYWRYNPPPALPISHQEARNSGKAQVIRIGNVLEILPQDSSPEKIVPPQEEHAYVGIPVPPPAIPPTGIPNLGIPPPEMPSVVSKIVQAGNVIQVVPTEAFESDPLKTNILSEGQHIPAAAVPVPFISLSSEIAPVPPPSTTPSNPLAFISSLLASSMSKPISLASTFSSPSTPVVSSSAVISEEISLTKREEVQKPVESCIPGLDTQQQQAIISAAVAAAATGVPASNLPIAHLISVLQQQSLLIQPISVPTSEVHHPPPLNESQVEPQTELEPKIDLEAFNQQRKERKERKRKEKELRRKIRREKSIQKKLEQQRKMEQKLEELKNNDPYDEDDALLKEAMTEVPELGSPMPDYEVYDDDLDEEEEEEEKKPPPPIPLPPEKGILVGPTYRIVRNSERERKYVSFADGVKPGYGTSPSGGEEIHSPPPQIFPDKEKKKKLRKKKKVKVRVIKQYVLGDSRMDSPPPPPEEPPTPGTLKLYPGCTHYTLTAPGTFVIYTQQPLKINGSTNLGLGVGNPVTIPPGMLIHSSALSKRGTTDVGVLGITTSIPPSMPSSFPSFYGDTIDHVMTVQDTHSPNLN